MRHSLVGMLMFAVLSPTIGRSQTPSKRVNTGPQPGATITKIDLNNATMKELESLPGVGKVTAERIVALRPIGHLQQLKQIRGMTDRKIFELIPLVSLNPPRPGGPARAAALAGTTPQGKTVSTAQAGRGPAGAFPTSRINLNKATPEQLETLPGIGPAKAQAIMLGRPYRSIQEITKVKGIGPATFEKLKDLIEVN